MGPVPVDFYQEWDDLAPDLEEAVRIEPRQVIDCVREEVIPKRPFEDRHFTKRELRIMEQLVERFRDDFSRPMVNVTHVESRPWSEIWGGPLTRKTWVDLRGLDDLAANEFQNAVHHGVAATVLSLAPPVLAEILDCAARADDTTRQQELLIRETLAALR